MSFKRRSEKDSMSIGKRDREVTHCGSDRDYDDDVIIIGTDGESTSSLDDGFPAISVKHACKKKPTESALASQLSAASRPVIASDSHDQVSCKVTALGGKSHVQRSGGLSSVSGGKREVLATKAGRFMKFKPEARSNSPFNRSFPGGVHTCEQTHELKSLHRRSLASASNGKKKHSQSNTKSPCPSFLPDPLVTSRVSAAGSSRTPSSSTKSSGRSSQHVAGTGPVNQNVHSVGYCTTTIASTEAPREARRAPNSVDLITQSRKHRSESPNAMQPGYHRDGRDKGGTANVIKKQRLFQEYLLKAKNTAQRRERKHSLGSLESQRKAAGSPATVLLTKPAISSTSQVVKKGSSNHQEVGDAKGKTSVVSNFDVQSGPDDLTLMDTLVRPTTSSPSTVVSRGKCRVGVEPVGDPNPAHPVSKQRHGRKSSTAAVSKHSCDKRETSLDKRAKSHTLVTTSSQSVDSVTKTNGPKVGAVSKAIAAASKDPLSHRASKPPNKTPTTKPPKNTAPLLQSETESSSMLDFNESDLFEVLDSVETDSICSAYYQSDTESMATASEGYCSKPTSEPDQFQPSNLTKSFTCRSPSESRVYDFTKSFVKKKRRFARKSTTWNGAKFYKRPLKGGLLRLKKHCSIKIERVKYTTAKKGHMRHEEQQGKDTSVAKSSAPASCASGQIIPPSFFFKHAKKKREIVSKDTPTSKGHVGHEEQQGKDTSVAKSSAPANCASGQITPPSKNLLFNHPKKKRENVSKDAPTSKGHVGHEEQQGKDTSVAKSSAPANCAAGQITPPSKNLLINHPEKKRENVSKDAPTSKGHQGKDTSVAKSSAPANCAAGQITPPSKNLIFNHPEKKRENVSKDTPTSKGHVRHEEQQGKDTSVAKSSAPANCADGQIIPPSKKIFFFKHAKKKRENVSKDTPTSKGHVRHEEQQGKDTSAAKSSAPASCAADKITPPSKRLLLFSHPKKKRENVSKDTPTPSKRPKLSSDAPVNKPTLHTPFTEKTPSQKQTTSENPNHTISTRQIAPGHKPTLHKPLTGKTPSQKQTTFENPISTGQTAPPNKPILPTPLTGKTPSLKQTSETPHHTISTGQTAPANKPTLHKPLTGKTPSQKQTTSENPISTGQTAPANKPTLLTPLTGKTPSQKQTTSENPNHTISTGQTAPANKPTLLTHLTGKTPSQKQTTSETPHHTISTGQTAPANNAALLKQNKSVIGKTPSQKQTTSENPNPKSNTVSTGQTVGGGKKHTTSAVRTSTALAQNMTNPKELDFPSQVLLSQKDGAPPIQATVLSQKKFPLPPPKPALQVLPPTTYQTLTVGEILDFSCKVFNTKHPLSSELESEPKCGESNSLILSTPTKPGAGLVTSHNSSNCTGGTDVHVAQPDVPSEASHSANRMLEKRLVSSEPGSPSSRKCLSLKHYHRLSRTPSLSDAPSESHPMSPERFGLFSSFSPLGGASAMDSVEKRGGNIVHIASHVGSKASAPPKQREGKCNPPTSESHAVDKATQVAAIEKPRSASTSDRGGRNVPNKKRERSISASSEENIVAKLSRRDEAYDLRLLETIAKLAPGSGGSADNKASHIRSPRRPSSSSVGSGEGMEVGSREKDPSKSGMSDDSSSLPLTVKLPLSRLHRPPVVSPTVTTRALGMFTDKAVQAERGMIVDKEMLDAYLVVKLHEAMFDMKEQLQMMEAQVASIAKQKESLERTLRSKILYIRDMTTTGFKAGMVDKSTSTDSSRRARTATIATQTKKLPITPKSHKAAKMADKDTQTVRRSPNHVTVSSQTEGVVRTIPARLQTHSQSLCLYKHPDNEVQLYIKQTRHSVACLNDSEQYTEEDPIGPNPNQQWLSASVLENCSRSVAVSPKVRFLRAIQDKAPCVERLGCARCIPSGRPVSNTASQQTEALPKVQFCRNVESSSDAVNAVDVPGSSEVPMEAECTCRSKTAGGGEGEDRIPSSLRNSISKLIELYFKVKALPTEPVQERHMTSLLNAIHHLLSHLPVEIQPPAKNHSPASKSICTASTTPQLSSAATGAPSTPPLTTSPSIATSTAKPTTPPPSEQPSSSPPTTPGAAAWSMGANLQELMELLRELEEKGKELLPNYFKAELAQLQLLAQDTLTFITSGIQHETFTHDHSGCIVNSDLQPRPWRDQDLQRDPYFLRLCLDVGVRGIMQQMKKLKQQNLQGKHLGQYISDDSDLDSDFDSPPPTPQRGTKPAAATGLREGKTSVNKKKGANMTAKKSKSSCKGERILNVKRVRKDVIHKTMPAPPTKEDTRKSSSSKSFSVPGGSLDKDFSIPSSLVLTTTTSSLVASMLAASTPLSTITTAGISMTTSTNLPPITSPTCVSPYNKRISKGDTFQVRVAELQSMVRTPISSQRETAVNTSRVASRPVCSIFPSNSLPVPSIHNTSNSQPVPIPSTSNSQPVLSTHNTSNSQPVPTPSTSNSQPVLSTHNTSNSQPVPTPSTSNSQPVLSTHSTSNSQPVPSIPSNVDAFGGDVNAQRVLAQYFHQVLGRKTLHVAETPRPLLDSQTNQLKQSSTMTAKGAHAPAPAVPTSNAHLCRGVQQLQREGSSAGFMSIANQPSMPATGNEREVLYKAIDILVRVFHSVQLTPAERVVMQQLIENAYHLAGSPSTTEQEMARHLINRISQQLHYALTKPMPSFHSISGRPVNVVARQLPPTMLLTPITVAAHITHSYPSLPTSVSGCLTTSVTTLHRPSLPGVFPLAHIPVMPSHSLSANVQASSVSGIAPSVMQDLLASAGTSTLSQSQTTVSVTTPVSPVTAIPQPSTVTKQVQSVLFAASDSSVPTSTTVETTETTSANTGPVVTTTSASNTKSTLPITTAVRHKSPSVTSVTTSVSRPEPTVTLKPTSMEVVKCVVTSAPTSTPPTTETLKSAQTTVPSVTSSIQSSVALPPKSTGSYKQAGVPTSVPQASVGKNWQSSSSLHIDPSKSSDITPLSSSTLAWKRVLSLLAVSRAKNAATSDSGSNYSGKERPPTTTSTLPSLPSFSQNGLCTYSSSTTTTGATTLPSSTANLRASTHSCTVGTNSLSTSIITSSVTSSTTSICAPRASVSTARTSAPAVHRSTASSVRTPGATVSTTVHHSTASSSVHAPGATAPTDSTTSNAVHHSTATSVHAPGATAPTDSTTSNAVHRSTASSVHATVSTMSNSVCPPGATVSTTSSVTSAHRSTASSVRPPGATVSTTSSVTSAHRSTASSVRPPGATVSPTSSVTSAHRSTASSVRPPGATVSPTSSVTSAHRSTTSSVRPPGATVSPTSSVTSAHRSTASSVRPPGATVSPTSSVTSAHRSTASSVRPPGATVSPTSSVTSAHRSTASSVRPPGATVSPTSSVTSVHRSTASSVRPPGATVSTTSSVTSAHRSTASSVRPPGATVSTTSSVTSAYHSTASSVCPPGATVSPTSSVTSAHRSTASSVRPPGATVSPTSSVTSVHRSTASSVCPPGATVSSVTSAHCSTASSVRPPGATVSTTSSVTSAHRSTASSVRPPGATVSPTSSVTSAYHSTASSVRPPGATVSPTSSVTSAHRSTTSSVRPPGATVSTTSSVTSAHRSTASSVRPPGATVSTTSSVTSAHHSTASSVRPPGATVSTTSSVTSAHHSTASSVRPPGATVSTTSSVTSAHHSTSSSVRPPGDTVSPTSSVTSARHSTASSVRPPGATVSPTSSVTSAHRSTASSVHTTVPTVSNVTTAPRPRVSITSSMTTAHRFPTTIKPPPAVVLHTAHMSNSTAHHSTATTACSHGPTAHLSVTAAHHSTPTSVGTSFSSRVCALPVVTNPAVSQRACAHSLRPPFTSSNIPRLSHPPSVPYLPPLSSLTNHASLRQISHQCSPPVVKVQATKVYNGLLIKWTFSTEHLHWQNLVEQYDLYAFVSNKDTKIPDVSLWGKVGEIKPLALPMAVTLTNFAIGQRYAFSVRVNYVNGVTSRYSEPCTIDL